MIYKNRDPYKIYEYIMNNYAIIDKVIVYDGFNPMKKTDYVTFKEIIAYTVDRKSVGYVVEGEVGNKEVDYLINRYIIAVNRIEDLFYDLAVKEMVKEVLKRYKDAVLQGIYNYKIDSKMYVYIYFKHNGEVYWARFPYEYISKKYDELRNLLVAIKEIRNVLYHKQQIHINI